MPIVNIFITREGSSPGQSAATAQEKARLIKGVSDLLLDVLGKPLDSTFVTIHEVEMENWGRGGLPIPEFRKRRAALRDADPPAQLAPTPRRTALAPPAEPQSLRDRYGSLSRREREVMALVVAGRLNKQVGVDLGISEITVKAHRGRVMGKMKANSFADLVRMSATLEQASQSLIEGDRSRDAICVSPAPGSNRSSLGSRGGFLVFSEAYG